VQCLNAFAVQALAGLPVQQLSASNFKRQFTFIDDVVPHIAQAPFVATRGAVVNLGADEVTTTAEVVATVADATNTALDLEPTRLTHGIHHAQVLNLKLWVGCNS
jgi:nucleoside-diphosphate-sugar epimerase